jgi:mevalonate kinase
MDTTTSAIGGALYIDPREEKIYEALKGIEGLKGLVVGYVNREASTGEMVDRVKRLRDAYPEALDLIMRAVGEVSRRAKRAIESGDIEKLGHLMNINHGLLEAMGVSTSKLSQMVYAARAAGALGSKITGAGGGGCIVALAPQREEEVIAALKAIGATAFKVSPTSDGVRVEE